MGGRRARPGLGIERCSQARQGPRARGCRRGARGDAHKRHGPLRVALNRASILFCTVPDKHTQHNSKYTADRMIPGAFEGETVTRRRFMTGTAHTAGAIAAASFALPALGFAIGPIFKQPPHFWEDIGSTEDFTNNNYVPVVITIAQGIGEAGKSTAYVRQHNDAIDTDIYDRHTPYIAISTRCAHLGCPVRWVDAA